MTLFENKTFIIKIIRSCETSEHIDLSELIIEKLVLPKFEKELETLKAEEKRTLRYDLQTTRQELSEAIQERKLILAGGSREYPRDDYEGSHTNKMEELT